MKNNLFIGRFQSPHKGHMHLFNSYLKENLPILIAIRDIQPDENNPLSASEVKSLWERIYKDNPLVSVIIIPDIASVNYGRDVGYAIKQLEVHEDISAISASEIRNQIKEGEVNWKFHVDENIHELLENLITSKQ